MQGFPVDRRTTAEGMVFDLNPMALHPWGFDGSQVM
jgi:hypothetical protein